MKTRSHSKKIQLICFGVLLIVISILFMYSLFLCLLVNSGIAQTIAEHSEAVYIANSFWFFMVALFSCKYLYGYIRDSFKTVDDNCKYVKKK